MFLTSTAGVSVATAMGVGVAGGSGDHPGSVYLVVRLAADDLTSGGDVDPQLVRSLQATSATVAADPALLQRPAALRSLAAAHVPLVNGGRGAGRSIDPRSAHRDLVSARRVLEGVPGAQSAVFVSSRHLNALDLGTSLVGDDVLVRPDTTVTGGQGLRLHGGRVVLLDSARMPAGRLLAVLDTASTDAASSRLALQPLLGVLRVPA